MQTIPNKRVRNTSKTIEATNTRISESLIGRPQARVALVLKNTSLAGEKITIAIGQDAILGQGVVLNQNDTFPLSQDGAYFPPQDVVNAIADVGTATLSIYEEQVD